MIFLDTTIYGNLLLGCLLSCLAHRFSQSLPRRMLDVMVGVLDMLVGAFVGRAAVH